MAGKWSDNSLIWLLSVDIIATTPSDNIFVSKNRRGQGVAHMQARMGTIAKNLIFWQLVGKWFFFTIFTIFYHFCLLMSKLFAQSLFV